jgi:hypothetical protein
MLLDARRWNDESLPQPPPRRMGPCFRRDDGGNEMQKPQADQVARTSMHVPRHCERSEAIHVTACGGVDCFVASLLAMTRSRTAQQSHCRPWEIPSCGRALLDELSRSPSCLGSRPDIAARTIWLCNVQLKKRNDMKKLIYRHRDIEYSLTHAEPDIWHWSFEINGRLRKGTTHARLDLLAQRRVRTIIDRELRNAARTKPPGSD